MKYNQPFGISDPNAPYINGNPGIGLQGSIPPAASIEYPQREIVNLINNVTMTPDNADLNQLARAIQTGGILYAADSGTATAYSISLSPAPLRYWAGMFLWVVPANSNSGPATINVNGLGVLNIVRRGGGPLVAGDMPAGYKSLLTYSALHNNFELYGVNFAAGSGFLPVLSANTTWYINGTIGDDTLYDGTTATISGGHGPFKTINRGLTEVYRYAPSAYFATLQVAAGTYPEACASAQYPGPLLYIIGAGKTSTFVTGANNAHTFLAQHGNTLRVRSLCVSVGTGQGPPCGFIAQTGGTISTEDTASSGPFPFNIWEAYAGYVTMGSHTFNAGNSAANGVFGSYFGGFVGQAGSSSPNIGGGPPPTPRVWTFLGSFSVGGGFALASSNGSLEAAVPWQTSFVNAGFVTGPKFFINANGVINTQGLGVNYFPGTLPGVQGTGGQYI